MWNQVGGPISTRLGGLAGLGAGRQRNLFGWQPARRDARPTTAALMATIGSTKFVQGINKSI